MNTRPTLLHGLGRFLLIPFVLELLGFVRGWRASTSPNGGDDKRRHEGERTNPEERTNPALRVRLAMRVCVVAAVLTISGPAHADQPVIVMPDQILWRPVGNAGMMVAVVQGDPSVAAPYTTLIKIPAGMKIPPHSHPDRWRTSVVVSGTLHFAFGDTWDETALKPFTPGTIWTEPPGANHFVWARDGEVIAMLTAMGPSGFTPVAIAK